MMRYVILFMILLVPSLAIAQGKITRYQDTHTIPHKSVPTKGIENGHEWVDLGLPSGVKWATCNVGTDKFDYYGDYFVWGNPNYVTDATISWNKRPRFYNISKSFSGIINYDPARTLWGGKWQTPTRENFMELLDNCTFMWTDEYDGGVWVTSKKNGQKIYLPACGGCSGTQGYDYVRIVGLYWSSTPAPTEDTYGNEITDFAYYFLFHGNKNNKVDKIGLFTNPRQACLSIRPVIDK